MEKRLIFRCPDELHKQIEDRMKSEYPKFKNVSQLIRQALFEFLRESNK
jgi:Arc/MetJ-type ribon-helix-helix transcriptional regulator